VETEALSVASFVEDARTAASLYASASGCTFVVPPVDKDLVVTGNRELLLAALLNLLQNAFKFTQPHTTVTLSVHADGDRVSIDVEDRCGGLGPGTINRMFKPFTQTSNNRSGLGLGLSIAQKGVHASGGVLSVQDIPGVGCIFRISLPRV
jgi:signal transduction histidine kinase